MRLPTNWDVMGLPYTTLFQLPQASSPPTHKPGHSSLMVSHKMAHYKVRVGVQHCNASPSPVSAWISPLGAQQNFLLQTPKTRLVPPLSANFLARHLGINWRVSLPFQFGQAMSSSVRLLAWRSAPVHVHTHAHIHTCRESYLRADFSSFADQPRKYQCLSIVSQAAVYHVLTYLKGELLQLLGLRCLHFAYI